MKRRNVRFIAWILSLSLTVGLLPTVPAVSFAEEMTESTPAILPEETEVRETEPPEQPEVVLEAPAETVPEETEEVQEMLPTQEPVEAIYPWDNMSDQAVAAFVRAEVFRVYGQDAQAVSFLYARVRQIAAPELRDALLAILDAWQNPAAAEAGADEQENTEELPEAAESEEVNPDEEVLTEEVPEETSEEELTAETEPAEEVPSDEEVDAEIPSEEEPSMEETAEKTEEITTEEFAPETAEEEETSGPQETADAEEDSGVQEDAAEDSEPLEKTEAEENPGILEEAEEENSSETNYYSSLTLADINTSEMFFNQSERGKCTLAALAMLFRRAARLNGNSNWRSIDEAALYYPAWIEGTGIKWNIDYAGISVGHEFFNGCTEEKLSALLQSHPEGIVAFNGNKPHAVLLTDYTNGVFYCADPAPANNGRIRVQDSYLSLGSQASTVSGFTAYWYVRYPKLTVSVPAPIVDTPMTLKGTVGSDAVISLSWNNTGASGYWIYRSESPNGPWVTPIDEIDGAANVTWQDTSAKLFDTWYYAVKSFNADRQGGKLSNVVSLTSDRGVAHLADGTIGEQIRWAAYADGNLMIVGSGAIADCASENEEPWYAVRNSIKAVYISEGITRIGRSAFSGCSQITTISFPSSLTQIGDWAFYGCVGLTTVNLPSSLTQIGYAAFRQCNGLIGITVPDSVTQIGDWAFSGCSAMKTAALPAKLTAISSSMFYEDTALDSVVFPAGLKTIGEYAFYKCKMQSVLTLPDSVEKIGKYAFAVCSGITSATLSRTSGVLTIGDGVFYNCAALKTVRLPACKVGASAFAYCYALNGVVMDQVSAGSEIGDNAFLKCLNLHSILIYGPKVSFSTNALAELSAVILVPQSAWGVTSEWRDGACVFKPYSKVGTDGTILWCLDAENVLTFYGGPKLGLLSSLGTIASSASAVRISDDITSIEDRAFFNLFAVKNIYFAQKAPAISASAFTGIIATAHFHNVDGSWDNVSGKNYGGTIAWNETHTYAYKVTEQPTLTKTGTLTGTCTACSAEQTVSLPTLNQTEYSYTQNSTTGSFVWKNTDYGTVTIQVTLAKISAQPTACTADEGTAAAFTVTASGDGLSYQWQFCASSGEAWRDCSSATDGYQSDTLKPVAELSRSGYQYRCVVTDGYGKSVTSAAVSLTVIPVVKITSQPQSLRAEENTKVSFNVEASGQGLVFQWEWRTQGEEKWRTCSSATAGYNTKVLTPVAAIGRDGYQYRCKVTDFKGRTVYSDTVLLTVIPTVKITSQPVSARAEENAKAAFRVEAIGQGLVYQWEWRTQGEEQWRTCSSATAGYNTKVLTPVATIGRDGYQYRCKVTDFKGRTVYSDTVSLTVIPAVKITSQPVNVRTEEGAKATFRVEATGQGLVYQWEWRTQGEEKWRACSSATAGYNTQILTPVAAIGRDGYQYRCKVTDSVGRSVYSNAAVLTVNPKPVITEQPKSGSFLENQSASFRIAVSAANPQYRWQYKTSASAETWTYCTSATAGYNTDTLKPIAGLHRNGYVYRCVVTANGVQVISKEAVMNVIALLKITVQPASCTVTENTAVSFRAAANGTGLKYQWQFRRADSDWTNCSAATVGYNASVLKPEAILYRDGYRYRCVVTDAYGQKAVSEEAVMNVRRALVITQQPQSQQVPQGTSAAFTVKASGEKLSYQWQYRRSGGNWTNCSSATVGYNSQILKPVGTAARSGYEYRCIITDGYGVRVTSTTVVLKVQ